jgi:hypothetical protein
MVPGIHPGPCGDGKQTFPQASVQVDSECNAHQAGGDTYIFGNGPLLVLQFLVWTDSGTPPKEATEAIYRSSSASGPTYSDVKDKPQPLLDAPI